MYISQMSRRRAIVVTVAIFLGMMTSVILGCYFNSGWILTLGVSISMAPWVIDAAHEAR